MSQAASMTAASRGAKSKGLAAVMDAAWLMISPGALERDDFSSNRHPAPAYCWSMIFSENRFPLFGIML
jgi:hypothetical protein